MTVSRYRRRGYDHKYVAFQLGGPFDPLPSWFQDLESAGRVKILETSVMVHTITGNWREVAQGGWIVYQSDGSLWEMNDAAFTELFYEVA